MARPAFAVVLVLLAVTLHIQFAAGTWGGEYRVVPFWKQHTLLQQYHGNPHGQQASTFGQHGASVVAQQPDSLSKATLHVKQSLSTGLWQHAAAQLICAFESC